METSLFAVPFPSSIATLPLERARVCVPLTVELFASDGVADTPVPHKLV
jgi:hypothetical protein